METISLNELKRVMQKQYEALTGSAPVNKFERRALQKLADELGLGSLETEKSERLDGGSVQLR